MNPYDVPWFRRNLSRFENNNYLADAEGNLPRIVLERTSSPSQSIREGEEGKAHRFQRPWFYLMIALAIGVIILGFPCWAMVPQKFVADDDNIPTKQDLDVTNLISDLMTAFSIIGTTTQICMGASILYGFLNRNKHTTMAILKFWNYGIYLVLFWQALPLGVIFLLVVIDGYQEVMSTAFNAFVLIGSVVEILIECVSCYYVFKLMRINTSLSNRRRNQDARDNV